MKCFYHSADLDGQCSGAIVKYFNPDCEMIGINYGQEFPWDRIEEGEDIYMVDFTLQPFENMERLNELCVLHWIDHHKTEVEEAHKRGFLCAGIRHIGIGACALTWEYFQSNKNIPEAVRLLSEYDVWDHSNPRTLPFQYRMRMDDWRPTTEEIIVKWKSLIEHGYFFPRDQNGNIEGCVNIPTMVQQGEFLIQYEDQQNTKFCKAYAFETVLMEPLSWMDREGDLAESTHRKFNAICANRGFTNSKVFDSIYDPEKHDLMITFCRLKPPAHKWTVSLYSTKENIDCGLIAKVFGGGGHKGAAGFQCEELPFDI